MLHRSIEDMRKNQLPVCSVLTCAVNLFVIFFFFFFFKTVKEGNRDEREKERGA